MSLPPDRWPTKGRDEPPADGTWFDSRPGLFEPPALSDAAGTVRL